MACVASVSAEGSSFRGIFRFSPRENWAEGKKIEVAGMGSGDANKGGVFAQKKRKMLQNCRKPYSTLAM